MKLKINTKEEALKAITDLQEYIKGQDEEWVTIDYSVIPKETFDKYGAKPFQIMKRKMRNDKGEVWNNINYFDAIKACEEKGYRLPTIQEMLVLLDAYKEKYPNNADINHESFLGIEELAYKEDVYLEWIYVNKYIGATRGGYWYYGSYAGVETLYLNYGPSGTNNNLGFRCAR